MTLRLHHRLLLKGQHAYSRVVRGMTLGVRAMLLKDDQVLLVKHSYVPGWSFPGGGVEHGESFVDALVREIREEAGAVLNRPPQLFGLYRNRQMSRRDHVALYVCRDWTQREKPRLPNLEIVDCRLFARDELPEDVTLATLARLREVLDGEAPATDW